MLDKVIPKFPAVTPEGVTTNYFGHGGAFEPESLLTPPGPHQPPSIENRRDRSLFVCRTLAFHAAQPEGTLSCSVVHPEVRKRRALAGLTRQN
jgi:hypothetical protein